MKQFFLTLAGVFAGMMLFFVGLPVLLIVSAIGSAQPSVPGRAVLELDLRQGLTDQTPANPFAALGGAVSVMDVVEALDRAEEDSQIKGLFVRLPEGGMTPAAADELRHAFRRFRAAGKPIVAHSQGVMASGAAVSTYMLGASSGDLWMQSNATLEAVGLATEEIFLGRAFDRYGVNAQFEQREEFKNAVNAFTQSDYTPAHREATLSWMNAIYEAAVGKAAQERRRTPDQLRATLEQGPYPAERARQLGLIDHVGEMEQARDAILERAGRGSRLVDFGEYVRAHVPGGGGSIALVEGEGSIMTGYGTIDLFGSGDGIYSDDVAEQLYRAAEDDDVKAVVFRVSSPGGSPVASEQILAAVRAVRAAGKPVVVSMGAYGASGGYWIASEADEIVAQPTTLTGSIGVYSGKMALGDALARFGVDVRGLAVGGAYADAYDAGEGFDAQDRAVLAQQVDQVYADFITRVARGRDLPPERVREIARGRVWTGAQARELGLVDHLGGYHEAVARAAALANLGDAADVRVKRYERDLGPFGGLFQALGGASTSLRGLMALGAVLSDPEARAALAQIRDAQTSQGRAMVLAGRGVG
ncbi:signal peptide peptidase SppA [Brevundimonas sp. 2R-24]|uniref:Signal peptide peptidase SppA n=1 Tax=Peiella sedimenti TaxID=3061083 RepID=A0ABT8SM82_9CAUL|nr:signal peptide peptidase SppA [Caulobacteraceae bacterium XZ-24]